MSSHIAKAITRYSASALDLTTTFCFLLFQDIKLPPIKTQYPKVERLSGVNQASLHLCNQQFGYDPYLHTTYLGLVFLKYIAECGSQHPNGCHMVTVEID